MLFIFFHKILNFNILTSASLNELIASFNLILEPNRRILQVSFKIRYLLI